MLRRKIYAIITGIFLGLSASILTPAARAADAPEDALKAKGLRRQNATFVDKGELDVSKEFRELSQLKRSMYAAKKQAAAAEKKAQGFVELAKQAKQQRSALRKQLASARSVSDNNRIVVTLDELTEKIDKLEEQGPNGKENKAAAAAEAKAREAYVEAVLKVRKLYDEVAEKYEKHKIDTAVAEAITQYNANTEKKAELGPSSGFTREDALIKKCEDTVLSESIPLRLGDDRLYYVKAVFLGSHVLEISIDTGASSVVLPATVALQMGISLSPNDTPVKVQLADGREIDATQTIISKLRVGKFSADNVECIILPANLKDASPLLGQSFLRHFTYKIDTSAATLTMTRVE
ncbi:MAG: retroviral-like aspartic protease family protein [Planctomycetia bacterium]|nr:retroviral-like aspartic protease family protein [Planctomycetia bacterium]